MTNIAEKLTDSHFITEAGEAGPDHYNSGRTGPVGRAIFCQKPRQ